MKLLISLFTILYLINLTLATNSRLLLQKGDKEKGTKPPKEEKSASWDKDCICPTIEDPVCCDGEDFASPCDAGCAGFDNVEESCEEGPCTDATDEPSSSEEICQCPKISMPQCCDGVEYENPCLARCDGVALPAQNCDSGYCPEPAGKSGYSKEDKEDGGRRENSEIPEGYSKCQKEDLDLIQVVLDEMEQDIIDLVEAESDCDVRALAASKKEDDEEGTTYIVDIKVCGDPYTITYRIPTTDEDPDQEPTDLELVGDVIVGGWTEVTDDVTLAAIELDLEKIDAEIREKLELEDADKILIISAQNQVVAGVNYKVVIAVEGAEDVLYTISYYKDLDGNISNLEKCDSEESAESDEDEDCMPGSYCDVEEEDMDEIEADIDYLEDDIIALMIEKGYTISENAEVEVVSAQKQVVAGWNYIVTINIDSVEDIEISYYKGFGDEAMPEKLELITEPPTIVEYAAEDGTERVMIECEPGYVLEKGVCVKEEEKKEKTKTKEEKDQIKEEKDTRGDDELSEESPEEAAGDEVEEKEDLSVSDVAEEKVEEIKEKVQTGMEEKKERVQDKVKDIQLKKNPCGCDLEYEPMCCDGDTKLNACFARCDLELDEDAELDMCEEGRCGRPESAKGDEEEESEESPEDGAAAKVGTEREQKECDEGYVLEGGECVKEEEKKEATKTKEEKEQTKEEKDTRGTAEEDESSESPEDAAGDEVEEKEDEGEDASDEKSVKEKVQTGMEEKKERVQSDVKDIQLKKNPCGCDLEYEPICCDGDTKLNACFARCDLQLDDDAELDMCEEGRCGRPESAKGDEEEDESSSEPEDGAAGDAEKTKLDDCDCPMDYDPVCCRKGDKKITFATLCDAECDGKCNLNECSSGACEDESSSSETDTGAAADSVSSETDTYTDTGAAADSVSSLTDTGAAGKSVSSETDSYTDTGAAAKSASSEEIIADLLGEPMSGNKEDEEEDNGDGDADTNSKCGDEEDPICCNGKDYKNPCLAKCDGVEDPENNEDECKMGTCSGDECICTTEYNPYCCDGETYSNPCQARCDGIFFPKLTCEEGRCEDEQCACPYLYAPICCNDENYPNDCVAECADVDTSECTQGTCEEDVCACTREYNPYCCDGTTYSNPCEARCDGHQFINFKCDRGTCQDVEPCYCPKIYRPICCNKGESNEQEFGNICEASCELNDADDKLLDKVSTVLDQCELGQCETDPGCPCTLEWNPVCCLGAKTYGNMCQAECDGFSESHCLAGTTCEDITICTMEYRPMCCNGIDYANPCLAEAAGISEPAEESDDCTVGECENPIACTAEWDPLCCGEITYGNECMAKAAGFENPAEDCREGKCDHSFCTLEWNPQCCDGKTYGNPCMAERAGIEQPAEDHCLAGRCEDQICACTYLHDPVCCDEKDYSNECQAKCNGFLTDFDEKCRSGTCTESCICTEQWEPICCGDLESNDPDDFMTYGNECHAECAGFDTSDNKQCKSGHCGDSLCVCTMESNPICCDGITYPNPCAAECDGIPEPAEYQTDRCLMGTCEELKICTKEYNPICCDEQDFSNPCTARAAGISNPLACSPGRCDQQPDDCQCTRQYDPHCCDDKTYGNACMAECDGKDTEDDSVCQLGTCESQCLCTLEMDPVCCLARGKQKEYSNQCQAECAGFDFDEQCQKGECNDVGVCTLEWDPYCCDGETYSNPCFARQEGGFDVENDDKCTRGKCDDGACIVPAIYAPVCCNGVDYDNKEVAECDGVSDTETKCTEGKCGSDNTCVCTLEFDPYCCDEKTYYNPCHAECSGFEDAEENNDCQVGTCAEAICKCTMELNQICCNGITYPNPCVAECDGVEDAENNDAECLLGKCSDHEDLCICTREFNPLCCEDEEGEYVMEYNNPCIASCDGISNPNKQCRSGTCDSDSSGLCKCTREYAPLCCEDEKTGDKITYSNPCLAQCDGIAESDLSDLCIAGSTCDELEPLCKCTKESNPYCCKDVDYANPCLARCDGIMAPEFFCQRGECKDQPEVCTLEYDPICCNGQDYANPCFAERDGVEDPEKNDDCQMGKCCDVCKCTRELNPICCDDDQFYANPCLAECDGYDDAENNDKCELGLCEEPCICTQEMNPVCCEDTQFSNPCNAGCAGYTDAENNDDCTMGLCSGGQFVCTTEWNPYCCDERTYGNPCEAEKMGGFSDPENNDKCVKGECDSGEVGGCTMEIDQYCCSKVTYDNPCLAEELGGFVDAATNSKCKKGACKNYKNDKDDKTTDKPSICTLEYDPICCTDKYGVEITYDNPCLAETEGGITPPAESNEKCTMGKCDGDESSSSSEEGDCDCGENLDNPICCKSEDGIYTDYKNVCLATCDGIENPLTSGTCTKGTCDELYPCDCDLSYEPTCCDGVDFATECHAECRGFDVAKDCKSGTCESEESSEEDCICTREYEPYCCNEVDDFNNKCLAACGLGLDSEDDVDKQCAEGSCASVGCECTKEYEPKCCDGKTYDNECVAQCNGFDCLKQCDDGACPDDDSEKGAAYSGILSLGKPSGSSQWNIMIVIIQLCILAVCCLSLGLSISFCFKNPNKLIGVSSFNKAQSFGRDQ